jgi:hypothetical protein
MDKGRRTSLSPTENEEALASNSANQEKEDTLELGRTKSVAESLSLPREIIFVAIVCSAQLLTREYFLYKYDNERSANNSQRLDLATSRRLSMSSETISDWALGSCHG